MLVWRTEFGRGVFFGGKLNKPCGYWFCQKWLLIISKRPKKSSEWCYFNLTPPTDHGYILRRSPLGMKLYSVLHYCPEKLIEAAKLSKLFESLITKENLNTVVAATMHNIQPRAGDNIKDFTAINMWYQRLDERYNFSLGPNILPLMTTDMLTRLVSLHPPFLHKEDLQNNQQIIRGGIWLINFYHF